MTIKDIARESGYSISTVSRALNKHPDVSEDAKIKIEEIVARHRFIPNSNARQLKQQQAQSLAVIVKGSRNVFFAAVLEELHKLIGEEGYDVVVHYLEENENEMEAAARLCRESKPLGLFFLGGNHQAFQEGFSQLDIPAVLVTSLDETLSFPNLSMVGVDDKKAAALAAEHLYQKGHREIAVLGGNRSLSSTSARRWEGCKQCFAAHGLELPETRYEAAAFSYSGAYAAMQRLLDRCAGLTAVFAMSDVSAVGAIRAIIDRGLRVPQDISVIGFDGIELSRYYTPALTTVAQPIEQLAQNSVRLLLRSIERDQPARSVEVTASLIERESVSDCRV